MSLQAVNHDILIEIKDLSFRFPKKKLEKDENENPIIINSLSMRIRRNHRYGLIGESTCGKTTLGKLITLSLSRVIGGYISFNGDSRDIFQYSAKEAREYHKRVQMIYQSPEASLNPGMRIGKIIEEAVKTCPCSISKLTKSKIQEKVEYYLHQIGLADKADSYPDSLSGGEKRRVSIIRVLAMKPDMLIADEPFSSLDASLRNEILSLFLKDAREREVSYLFILHDLDVAKSACETIAVMYMGRIVEIGKSHEILSENAVRHPYTDTLFYAQYPEKIKDWSLPQLVCLPGEKGCAFHKRCYLYLHNELDSNQKSRCENETPEVPLLDEGEVHHRIACHFRKP